MLRTILSWSMVVAWLVQVPLVGSAQENEPPTKHLEVSVMGEDGIVATRSVSAILSYQYGPGMTKPQRMVAMGGYGGMGGYGMGMGADLMGGGMGSGMGGMMGGEGGYGGMGGMMGGMPGGGGSPSGTQSGESRILHALLTRADASIGLRPEVLVCTLAPKGMMSGGMASMGMSSGMGEGGMMDAAAERPVYLPLELELPINQIRIGRGGPVLGQPERQALADLVRYDVWIEQARGQLRTNKSDGQAFKALESELKLLLTEEYDKVLLKQQSDLDRLREKLKQVEDELARRSAAKDRVIDVQLGKMVLEAQGLISQ